MSLGTQGKRRSDIFAFGDWEGHLKRADLQCWARIVITMQKLREKATSRGDLHPPKVEKQEAAFSAVVEFIRYAAEWCQHEQDRRTCEESPFTESREAEVIAAVHRVLDAIPNMLAYDGVEDSGLTEDERREVTRSCIIRKTNFVNGLIRPRFYDGRADFQAAKNVPPTSSPTDRNADQNEKPDGGPPLENPPNRYDKLDELQNAHRKAWLSFLYAETKNEKRLEDRDAFDWLEENGIELTNEGQELVDYKLPDYGT